MQDIFVFLIRKTQQNRRRFPNRSSSIVILLQWLLLKTAKETVEQFTEHCSKVPQGYTAHHNKTPVSYEKEIRISCRKTVLPGVVK